MSGVYIQGMEMPTGGAFVELLIWSDGHVTKTGDSYLAEDGKHYYKPCDWECFSAIPVPDHGRLIDADALAEIHRQWAYKQDSSYQFHVTAREWVIEAPTVIPEDKEGG